MNFDGFKEMFGDFQQMVLTFQEISRESVDGSFSSMMRNAKVSLKHVCVTTVLCYYHMCNCCRVLLPYVLSPSCVTGTYIFPSLVCYRTSAYSPRRTEYGVDITHIMFVMHALTHVYMQMPHWGEDHELTSLLLGDTGVSIVSPSKNSLGTKNMD